MRITVLVDDTAKSDSFLAEHGLSFYIEPPQHKILFDMGQSNAFIENAKRLNVDLSAVDIAILSHGHYDHAPVYIHQDAFAPHAQQLPKYPTMYFTGTVQKQYAHLKSFMGHRLEALPAGTMLDIEFQI